MYDWTIVDRILDTYLDAGATPLVESDSCRRHCLRIPEPYSPVRKPGDKFVHYYRVGVPAQRLR